MVGLPRPFAIRRSAETNRILTATDAERIVSEARRTADPSDLAKNHTRATLDAVLEYALLERRRTPRNVWNVNRHYNLHDAIRGLRTAINGAD